MSTTADSADLALEQQVLSLKFLVSSKFAGCLIGTGGNAIKELMEVSKARVIISGTRDYFPGTTDRVLVLSGDREALLIAITLVWELLYIQAKADKTKTDAPEWSPLASKNFLTAKDDMELTARITIPAAAGGLILGREGATLKKITESSGADVKMTTKEEAIFTQERVVTITGPVSKGRICTQMILEKMREEVESNVYANRGTKYSPVASGLPSLRGQRRPRTTDGKEAAPVVAVKDTTITMTIPNSEIGNILGKSGSTLKEMVSLSGAKITVSAREESTDGNRTVTITGSATAAQTAHAFCNEKVRRGAYAKATRTPRRDSRRAALAAAAALAGQPVHLDPVERPHVRSVHRLPTLQHRLAVSAGNVRRSPVRRRQPGLPPVRQRVRVRLLGRPLALVLDRVDRLAEPGLARRWRLGVGGRQPHAVRQKMVLGLPSGPDPRGKRAAAHRGRRLLRRHAGPDGGVLLGPRHQRQLLRQRPGRPGAQRLPHDAGQRLGLQQHRSCAVLSGLLDSAGHQHARECGPAPVR